MNLEHLKSGSWYRFLHKRKGAFYGRYAGRVGNYDDPTDPLLLEVDIWTEDGSGQERYAHSFLINEDGAKHRPVLSRSRIRPSLLDGILTPPSAEQARLEDVERQMAKVKPALVPEQKPPDYLWLVPAPEPEPEPAPAPKKTSWWKKLIGGS